MWVPGKIALAAAACATAALVGCSGPLDSPTPRPRVARDAGTDHLRDVAPDRGGDLADRGPGPRDTAPEVIVDRPVIIIDAPVEVPEPWPVVPGCVLGQEPHPFYQPTFEANPLVVGCGELTRTVATLFDSSRAGFIFTAAFDPPLEGFDLSPAQGLVCSNGQGVPITVIAPDFLVRHPGSSGNVSVRITIQGPGPTSFPIVFPFTVVTTDFTVANEMIDFGLVPIGTSRTTEVVFANLRSSPAIQWIYTMPEALDPFSFSMGAASRPSTSPLEAGQSGALLTAYFYSGVVGSFTSTFIVTPFAPGMPLDRACSGVTRTVTLHGQAYVPRGPIP